MHVLTKIFIVLVTLLAIAMVPLVAVYTHNEDSYRARYQRADNERRVAQIQVTDAQQALVSERAQMQQEIDARDAQIARLRTDMAGIRSDIESLRAETGRLQAELAQRDANLQALAAASDVNSRLKERFVSENYDLRERVLRAERVVMEIEDKLEESRQAFEVAEAARRKAIEERHRLEKELGSMTARIDDYVARFGSLDATAEANDGVAPDRTLTATVLAVSREDGNVLAEINSGSRDGIQRGWVMTIGSDGTFLGRFQIEEVDINRSIGRVTLESPDRGLVSPGSTAYAIKGRN